MLVQGTGGILIAIVCLVRCTASECVDHKNQCQNVTSKPFLCYNTSILQNCCDSCNSVSRKDAPDCKYGDRNQQLCQKSLSPEQCSHENISQQCCETCSKPISARFNPIKKSNTVYNSLERALSWSSNAEGLSQPSTEQTISYAQPSKTSQSAHSTETMDKADKLTTFTLELSDTTDGGEHATKRDPPTTPSLMKSTTTKEPTPGVEEQSTDATSQMPTKTLMSSRRTSPTSDTTTQVAVATEDDATSFMETDLYSERLPSTTNVISTSTTRISSEGTDDGETSTTSVQTTTPIPSQTTPPKISTPTTSKKLTTVPHFPDMSSTNDFQDFSSLPPINTAPENTADIGTSTNAIIEDSTTSTKMDDSTTMMVTAITASAKTERSTRSTTVLTTEGFEDLQSTSDVGTIEKTTNTVSLSTTDKMPPVTTRQPGKHTTEIQSTTPTQQKTSSTAKTTSSNDLGSPGMFTNDEVMSSESPTATTIFVISKRTETTASPTDTSFPAESVEPSTTTPTTTPGTTITTHFQTDPTENNMASYGMFTNDEIMSTDLQPTTTSKSESTSGKDGNAATTTILPLSTETMMTTDSTQSKTETTSMTAKTEGSSGFESTDIIATEASMSPDSDLTTGATTSVKANSTLATTLLKITTTVDAQEETTVEMATDDISQTKTDMLSTSTSAIRTTTVAVSNTDNTATANDFTSPSQIPAETTLEEEQMSSTDDVDTTAGPDRTENTKASSKFITGSTDETYSTNDVEITTASARITTTTAKTHTNSTFEMSTSHETLQPTISELMKTSTPPEESTTTTNISPSSSQQTATTQSDKNFTAISNTTNTTTTASISPTLTQLINQTSSTINQTFISTSASVANKTKPTTTSNISTSTNAITTSSNMSSEATSTTTVSSTNATTIITDITNTSTTSSVKTTPLTTATNSTTSPTARDSTTPEATTSAVAPTATTTTSGASENTTTAPTTTPLPAECNSRNQWEGCDDFISTSTDLCYIPNVYENCCTTCYSYVIAGQQESCRYGNRQRYCATDGNIDCNSEQVKRDCCYTCYLQSINTVPVTNASVTTSITEAATSSPSKPDTLESVTTLVKKSPLDGTLGVVVVVLGAVTLLIIVLVVVVFCSMRHSAHVNKYSVRHSGSDIVTTSL